MFGKNKRPKSPIKIIRDIKTINHEYGITCGSLGDLEFKIAGLKKQVQEQHKRLHELVEEHKAAQAEIDRKVQVEAQKAPKKLDKEAVGA